MDCRGEGGSVKSDFISKGALIKHLMMGEGHSAVQSFGLKVAMGSAGHTSSCQYTIKICLNLTFHMVSRVAS